MVSIFFFFLFHWLTESQQSPAPMSRLSEYGFFKGNIADQTPADGVYPYSLKTPLFTDYAEKLRFVCLPQGEAVSYNSHEVLDFPVGTALIKTFYYPNDFRKPEKGRRLMETRVLLHEKNGWKAYPYVWNEEQTDAFLEVAGETLEARYIDAEGRKKKYEYGVPNVNQCKGCHNRNEAMSPIGPSARQLNSGLEIPVYLASKAVSAYKSGNQLENLNKMGALKGLPDKSEWPEIADWKDEAYPLDERARAWLDINCAHCHRPEGPANTSGLNLSIHNTDKTSYGILKAPVATGRAAGDFKWDIVPGKPDESILVYRISSTDPGIMMPELGRKTVHQESVRLISDWIKSLH